MRPSSHAWLLALLCVLFEDDSKSKGSALSSPRVLIVGGTGRIGTAVATRLLQRCPGARIRLAGRDPARGARAVREVGDAAFELLDFRDEAALRRCVRDCDAVVHVAGPFYGQEPTVLRACLDAEVPAYVDVADPPEFLDAALAMHESAGATTALLCAGAFPGASNVFATHAADGLDVDEVRFSYFTSGLGGSGTINLEITNFGFAEADAGADLGVVDFPVVGRRAVWAWPFPEQVTVARALNASRGVAGMGTAPDVWNAALRVLVDLVPRAWWRSAAFSRGLAAFSEPLVKLTDAFLPETHAMRIDLLAADRRATVRQAHESFRRCVGQSAAEFCLDLLHHPDPGVFLPEQRYRDPRPRARIVRHLTSTPGTTHFSIETTPLLGGKEA